MYDLRQTGYIERDEVWFSWISLSLEVSCNFVVYGENITGHFFFHNNNHNAFANLEVIMYLQLKEMLLALLHESDLVLSDDIIETIVDKV